MPTIIREGKLEFVFPDGWHVVKYDETEFYRHKIEPLGAELAAVDFICTRPDNIGPHTILLEVKDFRGYAVENRKRQTSGDLVKEVIKKCMHTFAVMYTSSYSKNQHLQHYAENAINPLGALEVHNARFIELVLLMEEDNTAGLSPFEILNQKTRINDMTFSLKN